MVVLREDGGGEKQLVVYYTAREEMSGEKLGAEQLRAHLTARLPEYMVPSAYVVMTALPLTVNGKVDRRALPSPEEVVQDEKTYVEPRNSTEKILAKIRCEALKLQQVGTRDNFFQWGGDSILILRIMGRAKEQGLKSSLQDVFEHQTIETLARVTTRDEGKAHAITVPFELVGGHAQAFTGRYRGCVSLSLAAAGHAVSQCLSPDSGVYHDVISYRLHVPYDAEKFQPTVYYLTQRHDMLRASIDMTSFSQPLQLIHSKVHLKVVEQDWRLRSAGEQKAGLRDFIDTERKTVFELMQPPLLRSSSIG